jgi:hypothetical protein
VATVSWSVAAHSWSGKETECCRERLPARALSGTAKLDRAGLPQPHLFNEVAKGNHFAAWQEPELFVSELRAAFRSVRKAD